MGKFSAQRTCPALLILVTFIVFLPALYSGYIYDDYRFIVDNPSMNESIDLKAVFLDPGTMDNQRVHDIYRPLRTLAFAIERRIGGQGPLLHHIVGILMHLINTCLVFRFITIILKPSCKENSAWFPALLGAALFALHPVQVESVAWISSRGDQLVVFFVMLCLINTLAGKSRHTALKASLTGLLCLLACLSKESGAITSAFIVLAGLCLKNRRNGGLLLHAAFALGTTILYLLLRSHVLGGLNDQIPHHGANVWSNCLYALFGLFYQVSLLFRPWFSNIDYQDGFFDSYSIVAITLLGLLYVVLVFLGMSSARKHPVACFAVLFTVLAQLPTSSIVFTLKSLVNDRYLYLPLVGVSLLSAAVMKNQLSKHGQAWSGRASKAVFAVFLVLLGCFSFSRCLDWRDGAHLWAATLETHSGSVKARLGLSNALYKQGKHKSALEKAIEGKNLSRPGSALKVNTRLAAARALIGLGRIKDAIQHLRIALKNIGTEGSKPVPVPQSRVLEICKSLWGFEMETGNYNGALDAACVLMNHEGKNAENLYLAGLALRSMGMIAEAVKTLEMGAEMEHCPPELHLVLEELRAGVYEQQ